MKKFFTAPLIKKLLLGAVVCMLVVGPLQPLVAHADTPPDATGCASAGISACLANIVYIFTVGIGSSFAYVAATFFNLAVNLSLNGPIYALTFISTGWTTARDLANMAFLFILIYIAFTIILEADTHGTMSLLAGVIVIALLVNFSFFFTRVVIDAGNILSIQFYNSITAPSVYSTATTGGAVVGGVATATTFATNAASGITGANTKDLTASIMGMLNLQGLFNNDSFKNFSSTSSGLGQFIALCFLYIAAAVMFWLLTVTFVATGIKFLMRIVVLWFLIIASPLAFVARTMPQFKKYFDQWREMLITHAFYPVAFMFIFLILTNFTNQMSSSGESNLIRTLFNSLTAANNSGTTGVAYLAIIIANAAISLGFIVAILYIGLKASDKISVMGASAAEKAGSWVGGKYTSTMGAVTGSAFRNTVGRAGNAVERSQALRKWEGKGTFGGSTIGKGLRFAGTTAATSSFDFRGAPGAKSLGLGTPQKGGFNKTVEESIKAKEKEAKSLEPTDGEKAKAHEDAVKDGDAEYMVGKKEHENASANVASSNVKIRGHEDNLAKMREEEKKDGPTVERSGRIKEIEVKLKDETQAKKNHEKAVKSAQKIMDDRAAKLAGEGNKKEYANYVESRRIGNMWIKTKASREAAAKIRKGKSANERAADVLKDIKKEHDEAEGHSDDHGDDHKDEGDSHGGGAKTETHTENPKSSSTGDAGHGPTPH